jgi:hypothetical protein
LIYSSIIEEFSQDQIDLGNFDEDIYLQHYRHQYIMRSQDGGTSWSTPYDLMAEITDPVSGNTLQEGVFGCISNIVNDNVYLTYQRDMYPGLNIQGDEDPITKNSIVFMTVPVESFENGFVTSLACNDISACNYGSEDECIYPGENEFAHHIEWFFDVNQIDNGLLDEEYLVFVQGTDVFSQGSDIFTQGTDVFNQGTNTFTQWITVHLEGENVFSQGVDLLFYGVSEFLDMIVEDIYEIFGNYDESGLFDCEGCVNDIDDNNICDEFQVGCPYPEFLEYDSTALFFDFSLCETYIIEGCMDTLAQNYNQLANLDDGTCDYLVDCETLLEWEVVTTGANMTLMIPADIEVTINGEPVSYGSAIGVFYEDSYGMLKCAGYTLLTEEITHISAMADDETTEEIDGLISGEEMIWKIYDNASCIEYIGSSAFSSGVNIFEPNNLAFVESVTYSCQVIEFPAGWFMFSTYVESENTDLVSILANLEDNVIIVKNNDGEAYLPEWNFNGIGSLINGQGYSIKIYEEAVIDICGSYLLPEENPISLESGWNTIAYLRLEPADVSLVMESIVVTENLIIVKDYNGNPYLPEWNYNGIGDLLPGQGYQLKTFQVDVLNYKSNSEQYKSTALPVVNNSLKFFKRLEPTGNNMHIVFPKYSWATQQYPTLEIAAYNSRGNLVGSTTITDENSVLTVWGDDEVTQSVDGLLSLESMKFELWNGKELVHFEIKNWSVGSNQYEENAINVVSKIAIGANENTLFDAQPNPANATSRISFYLIEEDFVDLRVYNTIGELVEILTQANYVEGYHYLDFNVSNLNPGYYYYTLNSDTFKKSKQLIIIK